jgi:tetratricopeptide (TPR) repeat protein
VTTRFCAQSRVQVATAVFTMIVTLALTLGHAQSQQGTIQGSVRDSSGRPVANATVSLTLAPENGIPAPPAQIAHTDSAGAYRFAALPAGAYSLRAHLNGYGDAARGPWNLAENETRKIDLVLTSTQGSEPESADSNKTSTGNASTQTLQFYDEPQFTVAGVTPATNSGGHGSDIEVRTTEALARATVALSKTSSKTSINIPSRESDQPPAATESSLRDALARNPKDAALHHQLADFEEKSGNPLEAVREYQRAAELEPSELYLFDWGTELLTHRALQPAAEVFTKSNRLFPKSSRTLIALGVTEYARGSYDRAAEHLQEASDLAPSDETPYLFMGKMLSAETAPLQETLDRTLDRTLERLARFQHLMPDNALANYYYAVSLSKVEQSADAPDEPTSRKVEILLEKAIQIDPKLGAAHLQLGILHAQRGDYARAILAYRKATEVSPELEEAHFRLGQAYRRAGDVADAKKELLIHEQLSKTNRDETQRQRNEIQEFVISLKAEQPE